jgi:hypothetical protein
MVENTRLFSKSHIRLEDFDEPNGDFGHTEVNGCVESSRLLLGSPNKHNGKDLPRPER